MEILCLFYIAETNISSVYSSEDNHYYSHPKPPISCLFVAQISIRNFYQGVDFLSIGSLD